MNEIINYKVISDRVSSSGQPLDNQFKLIKEQGFDVVINLAMPNSENVIPEEGNIVTAHGMSYVNIPVPWDAPAENHLVQFCGIMQAYKDKKVWIHCVKNYRVSAFLYRYYRDVLDKSEEDSKKVILESWTPVRIWADFMNNRIELSK